MPRYIDAAPYEDGRIVLNKEDAGVPVAEIPTADVVEVVRCKDCEYCEEVDFGLWYCNSEDFKVVGSYTEADFYCGAGLRKHRKEKEDGSNNT